MSEELSINLLHHDLAAIANIQPLARGHLVELHAVVAVMASRSVARSVRAASLVAPPSPVAEVSAKKSLMVSLIFIIIKTIIDLLFAFIGVKKQCGLP